MLPYVSVDLDLDQQLVHLSAAAHMAFYLYRVNSARSQFMPTQSYVDIMIMVKNVYYCVAKVKVDNPHGSFYPILLGTDRLETFFGLIRTAVGTDANVDLLQLGSRASGLTEVAAILAEHPEWDIGTRRLALPQITQLEKLPLWSITSPQRTGVVMLQSQELTFTLVGSWAVEKL